MARPTTPPSGNEITWPENEIIVSKTDTKGIITYANKTFCKVSGYTVSELLGKNHNLIRHPEMPQCVFKLLWDVLGSGNEIFAYVNNQAKNGDNYWVLAHVTPDFGENGEIVGFHSFRRVPRKEPVETMKGIYQTLLEEEQKHSNPKEGMEASTAILVGLLEQNNITYDKFVLSL